MLEVQNEFAWGVGSGSKGNMAEYRSTEDALGRAERIEVKNTGC